MRERGLRLVVNDGEYEIRDLKLSREKIGKRETRRPFLCAPSIH